MTGSGSSGVSFKSEERFFGYGIRPRGKKYDSVSLVSFPIYYNISFNILVGIRWSITLALTAFSRYRWRLRTVDAKAPR